MRRTILDRNPSGADRRMHAAALSPNKAVATMFDLLASLNRKASEQVSTATSKTVLPGAALAKRAAMAKPVTPPAQPRPNTGTRSTSDQKPISTAA